MIWLCATFIKSPKTILSLIIISFPHIIQTYSIAVIMIGLITHSSIALRNKLWIIVKEQQRKIHKSILLHLLQPPFAEER